MYKYDGEIEEESLLKWVKNCLAEKLKATSTFDSFCIIDSLRFVTLPLANFYLIETCFYLL